MPFQKNNTLSTGRPPGAANKLKNIEQLHDLLQVILADLAINYDSLTNSDKVKLLIGYKHYFGLPITEPADFNFDFN